MSAQKMTVKFRKKNNVPYSIGKLSGTQFRCGNCGKVFFTRNEIDIHLNSEKPSGNRQRAFPELNKNLDLRVIYTQDIRDLTNPKFLKLKKGEEFFNYNRIKK